MPIPINDTFTPRGVGYPLLNAKDVQMPNGKRLSELDLTVPTKDELVQAVMDALPAAEGVSF